MNTSHLRLSIIARRTIEVSPILLAMVFHAIAMERWMLILPALIAVIYGVLRLSSESLVVRSSSRQWYGVIIGGLVLGLVVPAANVSSGPLPPAGAAAMTGIAVAICLYAVFTRQLTVGWVSAWTIVAISGNMELVSLLRIALIGFLVASLVAASLRAGLLKNRIREVAIWGVFVAAIASSTWFISVAITRVEQMLLGTVERFVTNPSGTATTGLSDSVTLGTKSTMHPSKQPLLELSQVPGLLRVKVMDEFNDNRWTTSLDLKSPLGQFDGLVESAATIRSIEMLFLDDLDNSIPSPPGTTGILNASSKIEGGWIWRGKPDGVTVTILADMTERLSPESIGESDLLAVPNELSEALAPLAAQLTKDTPSVESNFSKAKLIEAFFHENFKYSLVTDLSGDAHPLVTLIRERRPAYCTYFATAMALMLRTQGVPTRIVTGFAPGEVNSLTGRVTVRASDAHAWVEVWSAEENRFVTFDPTPYESRREMMGHNKLEGTLQTAASALRSAIRRLWLLMRYQPSTGIKALLSSPLLWICIVGLIWLWRNRSRRSSLQRQTVKTTPIDARLKQQYERYWTALRTAGVDPKPSETDDELIAKLEAIGDKSLWEAANRFILRYRDFRYGGESFDASLDKFDTPK